MFKLYWFYLNIFFFIFFLCFVIPAHAEGNKEIDEQITGSFKCAFIMIQDMQPIPVKDSVMNSEMLKNKLILYYKPISNAYFYIYFCNPGKEFKPLRPISFNNFKKYNYFYNPDYIYFTDTNQLFPETECWEIHLVISTKRLPEVEELITDLTEIPPDRKDTIIELTNKLESEIRNLKVKIIQGDHPVEIEETVNQSYRTLPDLINNPFHANDNIELWLDNSTIPINFTGIYEVIFQYECKAKN